MNHTIVNALVGAAGPVLLSLLSARRRPAHETVRAVSLFGRVLVTAGVITGIQYAVIRYAHNNPGLLLATLGAPALLAAVSLVRAMTVTSVTTTRRAARR